MSAFPYTIMHWHGWLKVGHLQPIYLSIYNMLKSFLASDNVGQNKQLEDKNIESIYRNDIEFNLETQNPRRGTSIASFSAGLIWLEQKKMFWCL